MTIALIIPDRNLDDLSRRLQQALPNVAVLRWPDIHSPEAVEFAVAWKPPHGVLAQFPALKAIQSFGAGVDNIVSDPALPKVPLSRVVDPALAVSMVQYLDSVVSYYRQRLDLFTKQQLQHLWKPKSPRKLQQICVLGLGELGAASARHFASLGYQVTGWSRSEKKVNGVSCFYGDAGYAAAVTNADVVICLLPLTGETQNLLGQPAFALMKKGTIFINVARGAIVDDSALLAALQSGQIEAACLDVFRQEPLPAEHPFWQQPQLLITPHCSAVTNNATVLTQIVDNYQRSQRNEPLLYQVNVQQGY